MGENFKFLFLLLLAITVSCTDVLEDKEAQEPDPKTASYSKIKNDNWRDNIGNEYEVEGILIVVNNVAKLIINKDDYYVDGLIAEENYINIEVNKDLLGKINLSENFGKKVKIKGVLEASTIYGYQATAKLIGDLSLATIIIKEYSGFQIIDLNIIIKQPPYFSLCLRYPALCKIQNFKLNKTALIYSGGVNAGNAHLRYWNDVKMMYQILLSKGYSEDKIRVVYKNGTGEDGDVPVHYAANQAGLDNAFAYLGDRMNSNTKFFLMMNNHGGGKDTYSSGNRYGNSGINDANGDENRAGINDNTDEQFYYYNSSTALTDDYLASKINALEMGSMIAVVKPCFSGGVIWDFKGPNRVIMTSGTEFQVTWSHDSGQFGEFTYHFFAAVTGSDPITGNAINADLNADGNVSMYEAQMYILANDARDEQPQYEDNNDGVGTSSPNASGFGASTYL